MSYATAKLAGQPLLHTGRDFSKSDLESAKRQRPSTRPLDQRDPVCFREELSSLEGHHYLRLSVAESRDCGMPAGSAYLVYFQYLPYRLSL
jgi:hypothetical protein